MAHPESLVHMSVPNVPTGSSYLSLINLIVHDRKEDKTKQNKGTSFISVLGIRQEKGISWH